jgi:cytochrome P450
LEHDFTAGDRVLLLWGSANRDGDEFADPESFVADRAPNRHVAFGSGVHRCLGAHLARVEFQAVIGEVLARLPDIAISDEAEIGRRSGHMSGIHRLPVVFTPPRLRHLDPV